MKFRTHIENIDSLIELGQLPSYDLDKLLSNIDCKYIELVSRNEWTPLTPSTNPNQPSSFIADSDANNLRKIICFNCGGVGHAVSECKQPKNDTMIEIRKSIMLDYGKDKKKATNPLLVPPKKG